MSSLDQGATPPSHPSRAHIALVSDVFLAQTVAASAPAPVAPGGDAPGAAANPLCRACNGYYGPAFSQPVCATCHAFLYADVHLEEDLQELQHILRVSSDGRRPGANGGPDGDHPEAALSDDDRDSGNEEPTDGDQDDDNNGANAAIALPAGAHVDVEADADMDQIGDVSNDDDEGEGDLNMAPQQEDMFLADAQAEEDDLLAEDAAVQFVLLDVPQPEAVAPDEDEIQGAHGGVPVENDVAELLAQILANQVSGGGASMANHAPYDLEDTVPMPEAGPDDAKFLLPTARVETLSERLALLTAPRPLPDSIPAGLASSLPPEVLLFIFSFLDDLSLYAAGNVCRRWMALQQERELGPRKWRVHVRRRWPLFRPVAKIEDWFAAYSALVESSFCLTCISQMAGTKVPAGLDGARLREKRLSHDLRGLVVDPPDGIRAQPLDSSIYHWQASITGPVGSPYEGGVFYLYLRVPLSYPFKPPKVRFLTKIFHPNVSMHGDIGIDILQHNWVVGLTIPKVLISIQSLLTDPYTSVCMSPDVGQLYRTERRMFDAVARKWTWEFAMHDVMPPKPRLL